MAFDFDDLEDTAHATGTEKLKALNTALLQTLDTESVGSHLEHLRQTCPNALKFERARAALLEAVYEEHGVDEAWRVAQAEQYAGEAELAEQCRDLSARMAFGQLGPQDVERGDCVELVALEGEMLERNGQTGFLVSWQEDSGVYDVHLPPGVESLLVGASHIRKLTAVEKARFIQKSIVDTLGSQDLQAALDHARKACSTVQEYLQVYPQIVRPATAAVYEWCGTDHALQARALADHHEDQVIAKLVKRAEDLASMGAASDSYGKGTVCEVQRLPAEAGEQAGAPSEQQMVNGSMVVVQGWDDVLSRFEVVLWNCPGRRRALKKVNLQAVPCSVRISFEDAQRLQQELLEACETPSAREELERLYAAAGSGGGGFRSYVASTRRAVLELQRPAMQRFGLPPGPAGGVYALRAMAPHTVDASFERAVAALGRLGVRDLSFEGRVAIVTGAGRGLGRAYARLLAARGAKVVVNNRTPHLADQVVAEIRKMGGTAVADHSNVAEAGERVVEAALQHFGRLDIISANAGVLEDRRFEVLSFEAFTTVLQTNLTGHLRLIRAAWPHLVSQGYGRIVLTSSTSGIHGNAGQSNYGAAKTAMMSLGLTLAMEGFKHGILVNVLCPVALTRMTNNIRPQEHQVSEASLREAGQPVSLPHSFLCHEACQTTGSVIQAEEGIVKVLRWQADDGFVEFDPEGGGTALEVVAAQWPEFGKFEKVSYPGEDFFAASISRSKQPQQAAPARAAAAAPQAAAAAPAKLTFADRVIIVAGSLCGLRRELCLLLAARGAKVIVCDQNVEPVDALVAEITQLSGAAVAARTAAEAVQIAMRSFDRLDAVVVGEDVPTDRCGIAELSKEALAGVLDTHYLGHVKLLKAAWPQFFESGLGRVLVVAGAAALYGQAQQAAYASAAGTAIGLVQCLAMEGFRYNIFPNLLCVDGAPSGATKKALQAAAAALAYLCHESCRACGGIFRLEGGRVQSLRWQCDEAVAGFDPGEGWSALEGLVERWPEPCSWCRVSYPGQAMQMGYRAAAAAGF